jgi:uncharacterized protein (TIGR02569 family)
MPARPQAAPDDQVLAAFGARELTSRPLRGGDGRVWSADGLILKRVDDEVEATWVADVLSELAEDGFRINRPVRSGPGRWVVGGWSAWGAIAGGHDTTGRWSDVLRVAEQLNLALRGLERPAFLDARTHAWAVADRMAWGESPVQVADDHLRPLAERLAAHVLPEGSPGQVVHGDLSGNVLFAPGLAPGVIDFTPYWRPALFSQAVVVVDALLWHAAPASLVAAVPGVSRRSVLARAALFRLIASDRLAMGKPPRAAERYARAEARSHLRVLDLLDSDRPLRDGRSR